jgi:hypothetical protein
VGIYGSHYFYYKIPANPGATVTLQIQKRDGLIAEADGKLLKETADKSGTHVTFTVPADAKETVALYENMGHENFGKNIGEPFGILGVQGTDWPAEIAKGTLGGTEEEYGDALTSPTNTTMAKPVEIGKGPAPDALLTWYRVSFELPEVASAGATPWHLHVEAKGNGFIYLNGRCLGRYWQAGPQHDFFLPESWLNFGTGQWNRVALDLRPAGKGVELDAVSVAPNASFAVVTAATGQ